MCVIYARQKLMMARNCVLIVEFVINVIILQPSTIIIIHAIIQSKLQKLKFGGKCNGWRERKHFTISSLVLLQV